MTDFNVASARHIYGIEHWGSGYFDISPRGRVVALPKAPGAAGGIDVYELIRELRAAGLGTPVLVRFVDILRDRVDELCSAFSAAMAQCGYEGGYTPVYPIKVNQQRSVVEEILAYGGERVGLEAGSKPELLAVLGLARQDGCLVVCNGYKDREYVRLALIGKLLGHRVFIVVEKLSELEALIEEARTLGIAPLIGVRVRLASIGKGKWQNTGGEKSKFGFTAAQVLAIVERLRAAGMLSCLQLLHFHLGSQIANIRDIQRGMQEAARYYAELHHLGVQIGYVDVGGGLGIDYEGSRSRSACSMNYSVQEYANNVVHTLWEICVESRLPHPCIVSEAGRAMTAHHAVLITDVVDTEQVPCEVPPWSVGDDHPHVIKNLIAGLDDISSRSALEAYHDAVHWLAMARDMYIHGLLTLQQRALAEQIYYAICRRVQPLLKASSRAHREVVDDLQEKLADKYFCNFSVFQSIPDVWAISQIFPIMPLHRLAERPEKRAIVADITCDSDGRIDYYVEGEGVGTTLPLHALRADEPYLLGIFLVGAYQEILGDMHNLFGDTNSVNVELTPEGGHRLVQPRHGDSVEAVLDYVHFDAAELLATFRDKVRATAIGEAQREFCRKALEAGLRGYTYLED